MSKNEYALDYILTSLYNSESFYGSGGLALIISPISTTYSFFVPELKLGEFSIQGINK